MSFLKKLGFIFGASIGAFIGRDIKYFPRDAKGTIPVEDILPKINTKLEDISLSEDQWDLNLKLGRESLDEVKSLTEYQDVKTSRLLTIIAFLTAAAGVVFSKIFDVYPLHQYYRFDTWNPSLLVVLVYGLFALFLFFVALGSLVSFHAMRTRFLWDKDEKPKVTDKDENLKVTKTKVKSFLFFQSIIKSKPEEWADAFLDPKHKTQPNSTLPEQYFRNYIAESYFIAAKLADKLRYLEPAQDLLLLSVKILIIWIISIAFVVACVPVSKDFENANMVKIGLSQNRSLNGIDTSLHEIAASGVIAICAPSKIVTHKHASCKTNPPIQTR